MIAVFTGFDSAWAAKNTGAICELVLQDDGSLTLQENHPIPANWDDAIGLVGQEPDGVLNVWAIDQPICVANESGCRPVEADLAKALMADFGCGAHSSNRSNPCWRADAPIWNFITALRRNDFHHHPMAIPAAREGRYYFECYPHPAILGLFDLDHILKYKVHHRNGNDWQELLRLLRELASGDLRIANIGSFATERLLQNQVNENKLDAIICAYVAAYWWKYGTERSTMIGGTTAGYIVTPHSIRTQLALAEVFLGRVNIEGEACAPPQERGKGQPPVPSENRNPVQPPQEPQRLPPEPVNNWEGPVTLRATDTTNLWRTSRGDVVNEWMDANRMVEYRLWVRFREEDGHPTVLFVPFANQGRQQGGMRSARQQMNRQLWHALVAGATWDSPVDFQILYNYQAVEN